MDDIRVFESSFIVYLIHANVHILLHTKISSHTAIHLAVANRITCDMWACFFFNRGLFMIEGQPTKVQHNSGTLPGDHQGFFLSCSRKANKPYICGRIKKKFIWQYMVKCTDSVWQEYMRWRFVDIFQSWLTDWMICLCGQVLKIFLYLLSGKVHSCS